jgi:hypothetical protein
MKKITLHAYKSGRRLLLGKEEVSNILCPKTTKTPPSLIKRDTQFTMKIRIDVRLYKSHVRYMGRIQK